MGQRESILLVDDSALLLELTRYFVESVCHRQAILAHSLREVQLQSDQALASDRAILDINLGRSEPSGLDIYHWLRSAGYTKPIYFLTGHASHADLASQGEVISDAKVLKKPLPADELIQLIMGRL